MQKIFNAMKQSAEAATTGARVCDPQQPGDEDRVKVIEGIFRIITLLRVTDPRSGKLRGTRLCIEAPLNCYRPGE